MPADLWLLQGHWRSARHPLGGEPPVSAFSYGAAAHRGGEKAGERCLSLPGGRYSMQIPVKEIGNMD